MTVLAGAALAPALPDMTVAFQDVPNAEFLVRLVLTMPALFIALSAPFAGMLLDSLGRKPVLIVSLILYGLAGSSGFLLSSLFSILVGRALLGVAVAGIISGFTTLIGDHFTGAKLNQFMGYQGAAIGLGGMVYLLLSGVLADIGWRFPFLIYLSAFLVLPGVLFAVDETRSQAGDARQASLANSGSLPIRTIGLIYTTAFVGMFIFFVFPVQLPFYLIAQVGASNSQVGLALSLQTLPAIIIALQYHRLKARLSFQGIFGLFFLTVGINHLIVGLTTSYALIMGGLLIGGLGLGLFPPNLNVWIASITPTALRGRAIGGLSAALFVGQFITPIITQPMVARAGMSGTFGIIGGVSLLLAVAFIGMAISQRKLRSNS
ncbi:MAG: MFS transporter [Candidatus Marinimicrobia bacterium]|nr:MFS transporter [Candidatus Neomarinimicrobiota bacterium]